jgi:hypothetical protein
MRKLILLLVMALSATAYGSRPQEIKYKSLADNSQQPAMFYAPTSKTTVPLVVAVHT